MSLILNGTTGISDVDGTAAAPALTGTDSNTGIFFPAADTIAFAEGGAEAMRITSAGNVGIADTAPNYKFNVGPPGGVTSLDGAGISLFTSGGLTSNIGGVLNFRPSIGTTASDIFNLSICAFDHGNDTNADGLSINASDGISFCTGSNSRQERARIDSSGNLLVGTTATASYMDGRIIASATSVNPALTVKSFDATQFCSSMWVAATTGTNIFANFLTETTATIRGSITYNRAGGLVAYNTTSDYRAKTVNGLVENALAKVALLKPSTGRMNGATEDIDFFVAHELQEVVPSAVTGEKDAVNEDSTPKYQMVDKSALIPLLTAAIQEQQALITALTARITALEAI